MKCLYAKKSIKTSFIIVMETKVFYRGQTFLVHLKSHFFRNQPKIAVKVVIELKVQCLIKCANCVPVCVLVFIKWSQHSNESIFDQKNFWSCFAFISKIDKLRLPFICPLFNNYISPPPFLLRTLCVCVCFWMRRANRTRFELLFRLTLWPHFDSKPAEYQIKSGKNTHTHITSTRTQSKHTLIKNVCYFELV